MSIVARRCDACQDLIPDDPPRRFIVSVGVYPTFTGDNTPMVGREQDACSPSCAKRLLITAANEVVL